MKTRSLFTLVAALFAMAASSHAQQAAAPIYTQALTLMKVQPGKDQEWLKTMLDVDAKVAQLRANSGEIIAWTLLKSVYPAGEEARAKYMVSVIYEGRPRQMAITDEVAKKAGVTRTRADVWAVRDAVSTLVATELWQPRLRFGATAKGHYVLLNYMKVSNAARYAELETKYFGPMAQEWIKEGSMTGWLYATKLLPGGSETAYTALTVDMFPTMEAAFQPRDSKAAFEKVAPGEKAETVAAELSKVRDLARRELWTVVERVGKQP